VDENFPPENLYAVHVTADDVAKKIFDTNFQFNLGTGLSGTMALMNPESIRNLIEKLKKGESPHRGYKGFFVLAFPKAIFGETSATRKVNLDTIESDLLDMHYEFAGGTIPSKYNWGYFSFGKLYTK
jgi:hypothetical protein